MSGKKRRQGTTQNEAPTDAPGLDCDIEIDCDLTGIYPEVLLTVKVGDTLIVRLESVSGAYGSALCVTTGGEILGAIAGVTGQMKLMSCLRQGVRYSVQVRELGAGRCRVLGGIAR